MKMNSKTKTIYDKFDKGIPIPAVSKVARNKRFFLELMKVGESFFVPGVEYKDQNSVYLSLMTVARVCRRATGYKFTVRTVTEKNVKGVRVWRTE